MYYKDEEKESEQIKEMLRKIALEAEWKNVESQIKQLFIPVLDGQSMKYIPILRKYAKRLVGWMRNYQIPYIGGKASLYDILLDCISTDLLMCMIRRYELRYWMTINFNQDCRSNGKTNHNTQTSFARWVLDEEVNQLANLFRNIDPDYYRVVENVDRNEADQNEHNSINDAENQYFLYTSTEKEFLKILFRLNNYILIQPHKKEMLHPSSFVALIYGHPCFAYCIEQHWHFYSDYYSNRSEDDYNKEDWVKWNFDYFTKKKDESEEKNKIAFSNKLGRVSREQKEYFKTSPDYSEREDNYAFVLQRRLARADFDLIKKLICQYDDAVIQDFAGQISESVRQIREQNDGIALLQTLMNFLKIDEPDKKEYEENFTYQFPCQLAHSACVRMFCRKIQEDVWESDQDCKTAEEHDEIKNADFYIGLSTLIQAVMVLYQKVEHEIIQLIEVRAKPNHELRPVKLEKWAWVENLMRKPIDGGDHPKQQTDFTGRNLPFLTRLMDWFYDEACLKNWIWTCRYIKEEQKETELLSLAHNLSKDIDMIEQLNTNYETVKDRLRVNTQTYLDSIKKIYYEFEKSKLHFHQSATTQELQYVANCAEMLDRYFASIHQQDDRLEEALRLSAYILDEMAECVEIMDIVPEPFALKELMGKKNIQEKDIYECLFPRKETKCKLIDPLYYFIRDNSEWISAQFGTYNADTEDQIIQKGEQFWKDALNSRKAYVQYRKLVSTTFGINSKTTRKIKNVKMKKS